MKKLFSLIIILITCTGCRNYIELNDLAIIKSIGIDYQNNQYTLYAEIIDEITKDNLPKTKVIASTNQNIKDLFQNIKLLVNKEIYLSHIDLLILSPNLQNQQYQEIIDYFLENKEFRNDFLCIYAKQIKDILENSQYDEIEEIITTNKDSKDIINITFEEIIQKFLDHKSFKASFIVYDQEIKFQNNVLFRNNEIEMINHDQ